jgi:hypothetical protein
MAKYALTFTGQATVATNDTAALTTLKYSALGGNSGTMQLKIYEVQVGGESSSAAVQQYIFARDTTVAATSLTSVGLTNALIDATATAPGTLALFSNSSTTFPQRSATAHLIQHSFNAFGGLCRWQARQGEELTCVGNTQPLGEFSYSGGPATVAGQVSGHIHYELV